VLNPAWRDYSTLPTSLHLSAHDCDSHFDGTNWASSAAKLGALYVASFHCHSVYRRTVHDSTSWARVTWRFDERDAVVAVRWREQGLARFEEPRKQRPEPSIHGFLEILLASEVSLGR
jgi:hypothetical protein